MRAWMLQMGAVVGLCGGAAGAFVGCVPPEITMGDPPDAGPDGDSGCGHAVYPPPPVVPDQPSVAPIVFAMRSLNLGEASSVPPGFDLDSTCTCQDGAGETCDNSQAAPICDADGGIDSVAAGLQAQLVQLLGSSNFGTAYFS